MEDFLSGAGDNEFFELENSNEVTTQDLSTNHVGVSTPRRKNSFVWKYFRTVQPIEGNRKISECIICNGSVGCQTTSNLARHLAATHNISKEGRGNLERVIRGRPSRSFIWKYCSKEDSKHARCHLCQKLLYFGGGNTANITKHLRRRHLDQIENKMDDVNEGTETDIATASILKVESQNGDVNVNGSPSQSSTAAGRKERKGGSYVWNYCDKLSRHSIRCKLCNKIMSFHGTANVITHLQRRHNVIGKVDNSNIVIMSSQAISQGDVSVDSTEHIEAIDNDENDTNAIEEQLDAEAGESMEASELNYTKRQRRSVGSTSVVWKYCTRIGPDAVRCCFCKKNLSYQGTSNLQRHLHRMHGVVVQGRMTKETELSEQQYKQLGSSNFIWEHCSLVDDDKVKCNMCDSVFPNKQVEEISKHLTITHAVEPQAPVKRQACRRVDMAEDSSDDDDDDKNDFGDQWSKLDDSEDATVFEVNIKKDESLYGDIIEEDNEQTNDEDPFDPNLLHDIPFAKPLSAESSRAGSPLRGRNFKMNTTNTLQSKKLKKLNEERIRMETEYFREKAGFYRMQKYLTALQAKKVRLEVDRLSSTQELNGASYAVNVGDIQPDIQSLPIQHI